MAAPLPGASAGVCGHIKQNGAPCQHQPQAAGGKCANHHKMLVNREEKEALERAIAAARFRFRRGDADAQLEEFVEETLPTLKKRVRARFRWQVDSMVLKDFMDALQLQVEAGEERARVAEAIHRWIALERVNLRHGAVLTAQAERLLRDREWRLAALIPLHAAPPLHAGREA